MKKIRISTIILAAAMITLINAANAFPGKSLSTLIDYVSTPSAQTKNFAAGTSYTLCFVPDGPSCEAMLVGAIKNARQSILIQAYSFTSPPIAEAILQAHKRGIDVRVIVDRSQVSDKYSSATFLKHAGIPVVVDADPAIAHNKVMIFDQHAVFTGSFNFTRSAQQRNAENGIIIAGDQGLIKAYTDNWGVRYKNSKSY